MSFYNLPSVTQSAFFINISITMYCGIFLARFREWPEWPGLTYLLAVLLISEKAAMLPRQQTCRDCLVLCHLLSISYCLLLFQGCRGLSNTTNWSRFVFGICDSTNRKSIHEPYFIEMTQIISPSVDSTCQKSICARL